MQIAREILEWLWAVFVHWEGYVFGGVVGVGLELSKRFRDWEPSKKVFATILATGLLCSMFAAWQEEYEKTHPGLQLSIDEGGFAGQLVGDDGKPLIGSNGTPVVIIATVRNLGAQSVADDWTLYVTQPGKDEIKASFMSFNLPNQPPIYLGSDVIPMNKLLYKLTLTPVTTGDKKRGILMFFLKDILEIELAQKGTRMKLTCHDVAGNTITSPVYERTSENMSHKHFPDLEF